MSDLTDTQQSTVALSLQAAAEPPAKRYTTLSCTAVVAGLDPTYGGPSYSVPRLCEATANSGVTMSLLSVASADCDPSDEFVRGYRDRRFMWDHARTPILRDLRHSRALREALRNSAPQSSIIHNHGIWLWPNIEAARAAIVAGKPYIVSPRGMLSGEALRFSRWKKAAAWRLGHAASLRRAACIHATSEMEYQDVRAAGLTAPVAIVPNGIDVGPDVAASRGGSGHKVLSLGRIHPKKGLDVLIRAWSMVASAFPNWQLEIVGPSENGHDLELRNLVHGLGAARVEIHGPVYGDAKQAMLSQADIFVLPTRSENFGLVVAEALAVAVPVICTTGAPWHGLEAEKCGWWIDQGVDPMANALVNAMSLEHELRNEMGKRGRAWMQRAFSWDIVGEKMKAVYEWLVFGGEVPSSVRII